MKSKIDPTLTPEQKEKIEVEWENNILKFLLPIVGGIAFLFGLLGFILAISTNAGVAIFLLILAILGAGGIAYGVYLIIMKRRNKYRKEEVVPSDQPNEKPNK